MKYLNINHIIPVLALVAVGCSSPLALQTSEYDDVYFASTDRVARPAEPAPVYRGETRSQATQAEYAQGDYQIADGEMLNPEYSDAVAAEDTYVTDNYYNETFATSTIRPRYVMPFNRFPSYNMMMMDPFFNPFHPFARRSFMHPYMSPMMMMDPFYAYDPFMMHHPMMFDPFFMGPRFGMSMGFGMGMGMGMGWGMGMGMMGMNPWGMGMMGMNPWGFGGMNAYHLGFQRGMQQGLFRPIYANNEAFRGQQTHYAPRTNRSVSPVAGGDNMGRPALNNTGRTGPDGTRSATNVNNATGVERGRYERNVDQRSVNSRPQPAERVEGSPGRNERPVLMDRPVRGERVQTEQISVPQDQQGIAPGNRRGRAADAPRTTTEYQRPQPAPGQQAAPAQEYRRAERSRPIRTESAPAQRPVYRDSSPSYNPGRSSDSFSRPSMSSPSPSRSSSPSMGSPAGGGRPRR